MTESIIKVKRREGFTILPNSTLRDKRLSLKTRAILAIMISVPDDWDFTVSGLASICGAGRDAVRSALRELEESGYLTRAQCHDESGHFSRNEYIVTDEPTERGETPLPENPSAGEPSTGEPLTENPTQQNKDLTNTPYSPPEGDDGKGVQKRDVDWELFEQFWQAFPKSRRKKKDAARKAWQKLNPDLALCRVMAAALEQDKRSRQWLKDDGDYIPLPSSWLNGKRWEDEHDEPSDGGGGAPLRGEGVNYL